MRFAAPNNPQAEAAVLHLFHGVAPGPAGAVEPPLAAGARTRFTEIAFVTALVTTFEADAAFLNQAGDEAAQARRLALAHHDLLSRLCRDRDVAPVALTGAYGDLDDLETEVRAAAPRLAQALARIEGAVEYVVRALSLPPARREEPSPAPASGRAYLMARQGARRRRDSDAAARGAWIDQVRAAFADTARALLDTPPATGGPAAPLCFTALVERSRQDAFAAAGAPHFEAGLALGLRLEVSGPWPPYVFAAARVGGVRPKEQERGDV